jgi:hypothetical protein
MGLINQPPFFFYSSLDLMMLLSEIMVSPTSTLDQLVESFLLPILRPDFPIGILIFLVIQTKWQKFWKENKQLARKIVYDLSGGLKLHLKMGKKFLSFAK